jgi:hypothetical protein
MGSKFVWYAIMLTTNTPSTVSSKDSTNMYFNCQIDMQYKMRTTKPTFILYAEIKRMIHFNRWEL